MSEQKTSKFISTVSQNQITVTYRGVFFFSVGSEVGVKIYSDDQGNAYSKEKEMVKENEKNYKLRGDCRFFSDCNELYRKIPNQLLWECSHNIRDFEGKSYVKLENYHGLGTTSYECMSNANGTSSGNYLPTW
jgi:hypothetical protein